MSRALVLAAGEGTRLNHDTPKPAYPLLGVPLLARTLFTLEEAGVTDAWVVVGHRAGEVREAVDAIDRLELRVHWVHNDRWQGKNGLSVLAAAPELEGADEPFLLTMSDHVFEPGLATDLVRDPLRDAALRLGVDARPDDGKFSEADLADATKVRLAGDRIEAIGKGLEPYGAVDTGVFLATPALFEALRACEGEDGPSLSDGVQRLADRGEARAVDVSGRTWHDVDTPRDVEAAERKLLRSVRSEEDGPVARLLNRPLSTALSRRLVKRTSVTPNQVSVGTLGVGLAAAAFAAVGGYAAHLAAGVLFQLASVLDGSDGEVAKLTFRSSRRGEWVDTLCDNLAYLAFLVGLTVGVHRMGLPDLYVYSGLLGLGAAGVSIAAINLSLLSHGESGSARAVEYGYRGRDDLKSRVLQALHYLGKRDMFSLVVLALALVGQLPLGLVVFGVAATAIMVPVTGKALLSSVRERTPAEPEEEEEGEPGEAREAGPADGDAALSAAPSRASEGVAAPAARASVPEDPGTPGP